MSLSGKIETTANAATIIVAVLLSAVLIKAYVAPNAFARLTAPAAAVSKGGKVDGRVLGVDWKKNHRTLVLAISTTCHYCQDSVPFYRKLAATETGVKMVAVLPQTVAEGQQYLGSAGVHVDEVKQVPLNTLGVQGTPTLVLVNDVGVVTDVWVGKLQSEQESQVLTALEKKIGG
jgi:Redoxin